MVSPKVIGYVRFGFVAIKSLIHNKNYNYFIPVLMMLSQKLSNV